MAMNAMAESIKHNSQSAHVPTPVLSLPGYCIHEPRQD